MKTKTVLCARCNLPEVEHWALNYSDGPHVSGAVLICPTATFMLPERKGPATPETKG